MKSRREYYDAEPWYRREKTQDWYQQMELTNQVVKDLLQQIIKPDFRILEVACGGGWLSEFILKLKISEYKGFDFAESAVSNAKSRLQKYKKWTILRADALSPEIYDCDFELIIAHQFLHCLIGEDRHIWMKLCHETLKRNNGSLLLSSMIGLPESHASFVDLQTKINKPRNRYYADDEEIELELNQAGFTIETTLYPEDYSGVYLAKT